MSNFDILVKFKDPKISAMMFVQAENEDAARKRVASIIHAENPAIEFREIRIGEPLMPAGAEYDFDNRGGLKMPPGSEINYVQLPNFATIKEWKV